MRAVVDPQQNALACALATSRHREAEPIEWLRTERVRHALKVGPKGVTNNERMALLSDPVALARLHALVWICLSRSGSPTSDSGVSRLTRPVSSPVLMLRPPRLIS